MSLTSVIIGSSISHYRIVEKLGEGGMGVVYRAEDTRLHRDVALKFLRSFEVVEDLSRIRFMTEARAAAALNHPNVCTIFDVHEHEGTAFIAMAYLKGESLDRLLARRLLNLGEALDAAEQIASGLQAAHNAGIVHRDIKPSNIIMTTDSRAIVVDFGLAMLTDQSRITLPGSTLGTTSYMSPEQLLGERVDRRTDIWAWGVVLYEMLVGKTPFSGLYRDAIIYAILNEDPPKLTDLRSGIPLELEAIVNRAMEKDPGERYQDSREILSDLRALREPQGTLPSESAHPHQSSSSANFQQARPPAGISLGWWVFHQVAVLAACALLTAALWQVSVWEPSLATRIAFIAALAAACAIATIRMHLLFTARLNRKAILRELSRVRPWLNRVDWCFNGALALGGIAVSSDRRLIAALLLGAAACYAAVFSLVEPATIAAVFERGRGWRASSTSGSRHSS